jgi:hypothetical protein
LVVLLTAVVSGQTVTGTLEGYVTDTTGAVIPAAEIVAKNADTGLTRRTVSNGEGYYQLTFLPVGEYSVTAQSKGFGGVQRRAIVELSSVRTADFSLKPAQVATEVTVVADVSLIETARGEVKSTIDERAIEDRPLPSRNILSLVEQLPGFQSTGSFSGVNNPTLSSGSYVSFNGTGSRSATFQIDGVNNDDSSEGINRQNVNVSSIKEFQVLTNAYSAEFGRAGGAVVLVQTKSGTNKIRGDVFEFLQNEKLNSNSFFNNVAGTDANGNPVAPRGPYRRNQFGYTVGAPVVENKLFLFHSFEQTRLVQHANSRAFLLPVSKIQVGECRWCVNPNDHPNLDADVRFLQSVLDRYPKAKPNATVFCDTCYIQQIRHDFPDQDYSGKIDWNTSEKDTLAMRYQYSRQKRRPGQLIEGTAAYQNHKQQNVGITETHVFTPSTSGEFRYGLGLRTTLVDISTGNNTPIISIANTSTFPNAAIGSAGAFPIHRYQTDHQFVYNLSHIRGRHSLKTGIDYRKQNLDDLADNYSRGWYRFNATGVGAARYEGWENLLRGWVPAYERGYGNFTTYNRLGEFNWYVLDDMKLTPALTLNLGFRIEHVRAPDERDGKILYNYGNFTGLEPRFGLAWSPAATSGWLGRISGGPNRMSVRLGFGLFHNRVFQSVFSQGGASLRSLPPYGVYRAYEPGFNAANPDNDFVYNPSFNPGRITIAQVAPNLQMPTVQQYHLTIDRQISNTMAISLGYNRTRGIGLLQNQILNRARFPFTDPATGILYDKIDSDLGNTAPAPGFISLTQPRTNQRRPDPRYGMIYHIHNGAWSYYNALRAELKKRYSSGLHFSVAYTFGKTIDTGSDVSQGNTISEFDSARTLRGPSDFDQRQRLNLNYSYRLPWFSAGRSWKRQVLGGWKISGNNTYATGNPFNVVAGYDMNADGVNNERPILLDQSVWGRSVDNGRQGPDGQIISMTQLPLSAFYPSRLYTVRERLFDPGGAGKDTIGRNGFRTSGIKNWDLGLWKTFATFERHELSLRGEMYNVLNSPRFALPTSRDIQSVSFARVASTYNPMNFVGAGRSDDTSRVVQLALRYVF